MISVQDYDVYAFDLDGTIYVGDKLLPGVKEILEYIRTHEKKIRFITNSSTLSREECKARLESLGIKVQLDDVVTALYLTGTYFREYYPEAKIFVVGDEAIQAELRRMGTQTTVVPEQATHVLVGHDRMFSYEKIKQAMDAILHGSKLVAINPDPVCPVEEGFIPDTMSFAKAIEIASGRELDQIIGKPSTYYGKSLLEISQVEPSRCLIIGDRLETDIQLGRNNGFPTCLVMTGVTGHQDLLQSSVQPKFIIENMSKLFAFETSH